MSAPIPRPQSAGPAPRLSRNPRLLLIHHAMMMTLFPMAVLTLYQHEHLGLSMAEVMLVQAAFGASLALFEFPSGYIADRIGYRPTLIVASALSIAGWLFYAYARGFWTVVFAELTLGLALSLVSGTHSAFLYESLAEDGQEQSFARWFGRTRFFAQIAEGTAALGAGLLFAFSVRLPFLMMVGVWVINLGIAFALVEPAVVRPRVERPLQHIAGLIRFVARESPRLRALFAASVTIGLANFIPVWILAIYARDAGIPVSWLGPIWAVANYCVAIGALLSEPLGARRSMTWILVGCSGLIAVGYFGMGLTHLWWGFVFYFAFNFSRGLSSPLLAHAEQKEIPSSDRASLGSLRSLLFRVGFILLGPLAGYAMDRVGQHAVLLGLGAFFLGATAISCGLIARSGASRGRPPA